VKKKRRAETELLMLGGCMPIRVWCSPFPSAYSATVFRRGGNGSIDLFSQAEAAKLLNVTPGATRARG
jgi:hypothetical protein